MSLVQSESGQGRLLVAGASPEPVAYALDIHTEGPAELKFGKGTINGDFTSLVHAAEFGGALELENGFGLGIEISRVIDNRADFVVSVPIPDR
jgi:hypothetical protein